MIISIALVPYRYGLLYTAFACGIISGINAYFLICAYIVLLLKSYKKVKIRQILPLIVLVFVEFLNNLFNGSTIDPGQFLLYVSYLSIFFYFIFLNESPELCRDVIVSFMIGLAVTLCIVSIGVLKDPQLLLMDEAIERGRMGFSDDITSTHFALNANNIAYFSCSLFAFLLLGTKTLQLNKLLYFTLLIIAVLSGVLSQSRTWVILICISIIILSIGSNFKQKFRVLLTVSVLFLLTALLANDLMDALLSGLRARFEIDDIGTAGGRTDIFAMYNRFMVENPRYLLSGTGVLNYHEVTNIPNSCHNATQQVFVCYGLLGILMFTTIFIKTFLQRSRGITYTNYIAVLLPLFFIQSIQFLNPHYLMLPIAMAVLILRIPNYKFAI